MNNLTDYEKIELAVARAIVMFSNEHPTKLSRLRSININDGKYSLEREVRVELSTLFTKYSYRAGVSEEMSDALLKVSDRTSGELLEFLDCGNMEELVDKSEELILKRREKFFEEHDVCELLGTGTLFQEWLFNKKHAYYQERDCIELPVMRI